MQDLGEEKVVVVLLREVLDLKLRILLHQSSVLIVYTLCYCRHLIQVLVQFLLSFLEVIIVFLFLILFGFQLLLDVIKLAIHGCPRLFSILHQHSGSLSLHYSYRLL